MGSALEIDKQFQAHLAWVPAEGNCTLLVECGGDLGLGGQGRPSGQGLVE